MVYRLYVASKTGLTPILSGPVVPFIAANPRNYVTIKHGDQVNATNTGYSASLIQNVNGLQQVGRYGASVDTTITVDGTVIRDTEFHGLVTVNAANVSFYNCIFRGRNVTSGDEACIIAWGAKVKNLYLEDCTMDPDYPSIWIDGILGWNYTLKRCQVMNTVDFFGVEQAGMGKTSVYASGVHITQCFAHDFTYFTPDSEHPSGATVDNQTHNDGIQIQGGTGVIMDYCNIQAYAGPKGSHQPLPTQAPSPSGAPYTGFSCVMLTPNAGQVYGVQLLNNLFGGGRQPINCPGAGAVNVGTMWGNKFDGGSLASTGSPPHTIDLSSVQTADTGDGTVNQNTFSDGPYVNQAVLVRHNQ